MAKFPPDRFDGVPDTPLRVGAHRSGAPSHRGWIVFAWAALATGILVAAGVFALGATDRSTQFADPGTTSGASTSATTKASASSTPKPTSTPSASTPSASATPLLDPTKIDSTVTKIAVLNATTRSGLAASASSTLTSGGWVVATVGTSTTKSTASVVYYSASAADNESIALGIAQKLGITSVQPSTAFPNATITVVLGSNYVAQ